ncbi:hypothetical protein H0X06_03690 [Candidatus Dependentiae bacterium]|nr:hypothetical protein [Candidatus Dependentiae bacterium]
MKHLMSLLSLVLFISNPATSFQLHGMESYPKIQKSQMLFTLTIEHSIDQRFICICDSIQKKGIFTLPDASHITTIASYSDATLLLVNYTHGKGYLWDISAQKPILEIPHSYDLRTIRSYLINTMILLDYKNGIAHLVDVATQKEILRMTKAEHIQDIHFYHNTRIILISYTDGKAQLWDITKERPLKIVPNAHPQQNSPPILSADKINDINFNFINNIALISYTDETTHMWDTTTEKLLMIIPTVAKINCIYVDLISNMALITYREIVPGNQVAALWNIDEEKKRGAVLLILEKVAAITSIHYELNDNILFINYGEKKLPSAFCTITEQELPLTIHLMQKFQKFFTLPKLNYIR